VVLSPAPHPGDRIFSPQARAALEARFDVVDIEHRPELLDGVLASAFAVVGQPDMPASRLARATNLRALLNVEGNFYPNVDYQSCFDRGIQVLGCGTAYSHAVAEFALGLAIDLARGISREDRAFRAGTEHYVASGNAEAILLRKADVGLVGFGNLGRALRPLLAPFRCTVRGYDPWLPAAVLDEHDVRPASLEEVLRTSRIVFVLATVTAESEQLLGAPELDLLAPGAGLVLVSRAPVVDFDALLDRVESGVLSAAIDVWPEEPMPLEHRARHLDGLVLSPHRAGGIPQAFREIGDMVLDDLTAIRDGLPPTRMQVATRELVGRYRNRPVS
jgi:phosphoglycerate dehydrogenase-like enzyme